MIYPRRQRTLAPLLLLSLLVLTLASCQPVTHHLTLIVTDASTGALLPDVQVTIGDSLASTDASGRASLPLEAGRHAVQVAAPGYIGRAIDVTIGEATLRVNREIVLEQRRLVIRVRDALTSAPVMASVTFGASERVTAENGGLDLVVSEYAALSISADGYLPTHVTAEALARYWQESDVALQVRYYDLEPTVADGIVVEAKSDVPLAGIHVNLGDQTVRTDASGRFQLRHVTEGYAISVSSPDHRPTEDTPIAPGQSVRIVLEAYGSAVTIVDSSSDAPLENADLSWPEGTSRTNASGRADTSVRPGQTLAISLDGYATREIGIGDERSLTVALTPTRMTLSLVSATTMEPITNAHVLLYEREPAAQSLLGTDPPNVACDQMREPDGQGRLTVNDATRYEIVTVKAPGYRLHTVPITGAGHLALTLEPFEIRGVYIPFGLLTVPERLYAVLDMVEETQLNAVVVDVKSDRARLAWPSQHPFAQATDAYLKDVVDVSELIESCRKRGIYTIARIVVFKDALLAEHRPELAVRNSDGSPYTDLEGLQWVDPYSQAVRDYNIQLALEAVALGFDEIQFDYLRFPSDGSVRGLTYSQESDFATRTQAMAAYCRQSHDALAPTRAFFSADIFGLTVWVDPARDMGIGQRLDDIAPFVDYLSPMLYPSTFGQGNLGFERPALHPYEIVYHSVLKTGKRTTTPVRPWLQHYSLGGVAYDLPELAGQRMAAEDAGASGWLFWNAAGRYMPELFRPDALTQARTDPIPWPKTDGTSQPSVTADE